MSSWLSQSFGLIGLIVVLRLVLTITKGIWVYFLRPGQSLRKLGSWAVVTGATDGIGRALCDNLARKGNHCCYDAAMHRREGIRPNRTQVVKPESALQA